MKTFFASVLIVLAATTAATAKPIPKNAVPLTPDELKAVYADKTAVWSKENLAYFAADGSVIGVAGDTYFSGKLEFKGDNELCMAVQGTDSKKKTSDGKTYSDCWKWVKTKGKSGKDKLWTLYSKSYDDKKQDLINGWNDGELKKLKAGNLVAARYKKLKGE
jgi:Protein of unknown function (DUF995)